MSPKRIQRRRASPAPKSDTASDAAEFSREVERLDGGHVLSRWAGDNDAAFVAAETDGTRHMLGSRPGVGREHHFLVPCALRAPIALGVIGQRAGDVQWTAGMDGGDLRLAQWLGRHQAMRALVTQLRWTGIVTVGSPPVVFTWRVQLRALGGGWGQLVLRAGYGDDRLSLSELVSITKSFCEVVPPAADLPQSFVVGPFFESEAEEGLGLRETISSAPSRCRPEQDRSARASDVVPARSRAPSDPGDDPTMITSYAPDSLATPPVKPSSR